MMMLTPSSGTTIMSKLNRRQTVRNRLTLISIALVVALPAVLSFLLYTSGWRPSSSGNYGELVEPPRAIKNLELQTLDGNSLRITDLSKKWTFVYIKSGECSDNCLDHLMLLRNVRLTQGKEISRIKRLFVLNAQRVDDLLVKNLKNHQGMDTVLLSTQKMREDFLKPFRFKGNNDPANAGYVYIVDPSSKVMMYYKNNKGILKIGKDMQKDMSKLLRNSQLRK